MAGKSKVPAGRGPRRDRTIQEHEHDSYKTKGKLKEPARCPECGAVFHKGRWTWDQPPKDAKAVVCPACHRINDDYPKGIVSLRGGFLVEHHDEILGLLRNEETKEKKQHALSRIMKVDREGDATVIWTTDTHLARRIGDALHHAYSGELDFHYDQDEQFIRVNWKR